MKNSSNTLLRKNYIENTSKNGKNRRGKNVLSYEDGYEIKFVEERLFFLKAQTIIDELIQIMIFIKELEKFGFENSEILMQIHNIVTKLRSEDRSYKYTKVVHVLTKYLSGIREFSLTTNIGGIMFYKKLFESTLVAIIRELDSLEEEVC